MQQAADPSPPSLRVSAQPLVDVRGLVVRYGAITAVHGVDLQIDAGEVVAIVGPNGAGKTSLLSAIAGIVAAGRRDRSDRRRAACRNRAAGRGAPRRRAGAGRPQHLRQPDGDGEPAARRDGAHATARVAADIEEVFAIFPILGERRGQPAGQLSGGEQQMLAIARAMLSRPRLLMLDEPSLGLAPTIVDKVYELLASIRARGVAMLVVEQNAARAFALADRAYVMSHGTFTLDRHAGGDRAPRRLRRRLFRGRHGDRGERCADGAGSCRRWSTSSASAGSTRSPRSASA